MIGNEDRKSRVIIYSSFPNGGGDVVQPQPIHVSEMKSSA
jgi:hypothetical protein